MDLSLFPNIGEIVEDGDTLKENALIKAKAVYDLTGIPAIADDTGLEVDALGGKPGVYTARFAGENCSYIDNVNKMLKVMKKIKKSERGAIFKTVMAFYDGKQELFSEGVVKGIIAEEKKGFGGFGYDPIFIPRGYKKTFAQMKPQKKYSMDHRYLAFKKIKI